MTCLMNHYVGDFFHYIVEFLEYNIGHQHLKSFISIQKLSPIRDIVSDIRHEHLCSPEQTEN